MNPIVLETIIVYVAVTVQSIVSDQTCTANAFLDPLDIGRYDPSRLVPLLGRYGSFGREQWIFFELEFTCRGMLTKWIFRGLPERDVGVELTTWRVNTISNFFTSYDQVSTTERNVLGPIRNGSIFTYELLSPAEVQPGDIVGIEMGFISFGGTSNNVIALNTSGSTSSLSYRTSGGGPSFILQSPSNVREQDFVPLLQAVVEPLQEINTDSVITTSGTSEQPLTTSTRRGPNIKGDSGTIPVVTIIAAILGGFAGIVVLVVLSVSAVCIAKKIQVHVHYDRRRKRSDSVGHQQNVSNSSNSTTVQMNTAYNQAVTVATNDRDSSHCQMTNERARQSMQFNSAYGTQGEMQVEVMEPESVGDYERMSSYIAFRQGNPNQLAGEKMLPHLACQMVYEMPLYQARSSHGDDNDEHCYDYIQ